MLTPDTTTSQQSSQGLEPNEAQATLAWLTGNMGQAMPQGQPEGSMDQESAPTEGQPQQMDNEATSTQQEPQMADFEVMLSTKLDEMRKELKADHQREIDGLKEQISQALSEDDGE